MIINEPMYKGREARSVHFPIHTFLRIDLAFMVYQLLGPEDTGMTKCPMQRSGQWGDRHNPIVPKPGAVPTDCVAEGRDSSSAALNFPCS